MFLLVGEVKGVNIGVIMVVMCYQLVALSYFSPEKGNPTLVRWWLSLLLFGGGSFMVKEDEGEWWCELLCGG